MNAVMEAQDPYDLEPGKRPLTVKEFDRMGEAGIFAPGERVELIDGELFKMSPIGSRHASRVSRLNNMLAHALFEHAIVSAQNPIVLGDLSEPEPDITVLEFRADYYSAAHPQAADILLLVEVADSSIRYDRKVKLPLYARHGVPEVWIFDLNKGRLEVHREPANGAYRHRDYYSEGSITPAALPDIRVDLGPLLSSKD